MWNLGEFIYSNIEEENNWLHWRAIEIYSSFFTFKFL
jgi:hypothetical protein